VVDARLNVDVWLAPVLLPAISQKLKRAGSEYRKGAGAL
jgi:hypothetical protein